MYCAGDNFFKGLLQKNLWLQISRRKSRCYKRNDPSPRTKDPRNNKFFTFPPRGEQASYVLKIDARMGQM